MLLNFFRAKKVINNLRKFWNCPIENFRMHEREKEAQQFQKSYTPPPPKKKALDLPMITILNGYFWQHEMKSTLNLCDLPADLYLQKRHTWEFPRTSSVLVSKQMQPNLTTVCYSYSMRNKSSRKTTLIRAMTELDVFGWRESKKKVKW